MAGTSNLQLLGNYGTALNGCDVTAFNFPGLVICAMAGGRLLNDVAAPRGILPDGSRYYL